MSPPSNVLKWIRFEAWWKTSKYSKKYFDQHCYTCYLFQSSFFSSSYKAPRINSSYNKPPNTPFKDV